MKNQYPPPPPVVPAGERPTPASRAERPQPRARQTPGVVPPLAPKGGKEGERRGGATTLFAKRLSWFDLRAICYFVF